MKFRLRPLPVALLLATVLPGCAVPNGTEMLVIGFVALLLFGGAKLPGLMRSMGSGIHEFKRGLKEGENEGEEAPKELADPKPTDQSSP